MCDKPRSGGMNQNPSANLLRESQLVELERQKVLVETVKRSNGTEFQYDHIR